MGHINSWWLLDWLNIKTIIHVRHQIEHDSTGIILWMHPANERWLVTSLIGWVHTQNDPWFRKGFRISHPFPIHSNHTLIEESCSVMSMPTDQFDAPHLNIYAFIQYTQHLPCWPWKSTLNAHSTNDNIQNYLSNQIIFKFAIHELRLLHCFPDENTLGIMAITWKFQGDILMQIVS